MHLSPRRTQDKDPRQQGPEFKPKRYASEDSASTQSCWCTEAARDGVCRGAGRGSWTFCLQDGDKERDRKRKPKTIPAPDEKSKERGRVLTAKHPVRDASPFSLTLLATVKDY